MIRTIILHQARGVTVYIGEGIVISTWGRKKVTFDYLNRIRNDGERSAVSTSIYPLPSLQIPVEELLALLAVPPTATLHVPITLTLTIRNYTSRSANIIVQLELDATDGFVVAGLRSGRVPILMPGAEEKVTWRLIPIECGHVKVPGIKVMNLRKASGDAESGIEAKGEEVKVIDVRVEHKTVPDTVGQSTRIDSRAEESIRSILVLP